MPNSRRGSVRNSSQDGELLSKSKNGSSSDMFMMDGKRKSESKSSPLKFLVDETDCPCRICNKLVDSDNSVQCDRCQGWVHQPCSDLDPAAFGMLARIQAQSVQWICAKCLKDRSGPGQDDRIASNEAKMDTMMQLIKTLQVQSSTLQTQNMAILRFLEKQDEKIDGKIAEKVKESMEELKEKEDRKNNLILYNIKECPRDGDEESQHDKKVVEQVFHEIGADLVGRKFQESVIETKRLGVKNKGRNRPIKVVLKDSLEKGKVLKKAKNLKNSKDLNKVGISTDKTLKEREMDKKLLAELRDRKGRGEDVLIVKGKIVPNNRQRGKGDEKAEGAVGGAPTNGSA